MGDLEKILIVLDGHAYVFFKQDLEFLGRIQTIDDFSTSSGDGLYKVDTEGEYCKC